MVSIQTRHGPKYPDLSTLESRTDSFRGNTNPLFNPCTEFVKAGFFWRNNNLVQCFFCGVLLQNVCKYDNPWIEHLMYGSRCAYFRLHRNLSEAEQEGIEWTPCLSENTQVNYENVYREYHTLYQSTRCKICLNATARFVYLPCSHLVTCLACCTTQTNCPICRKEIESILKIFI